MNVDSGDPVTANKRKISLIIPIRLTDQVYQGEERLTRILHSIPRDVYDILIVDEGTPKEHQDFLTSCATDGVTVLLRPELEESPFSIGRARNYGVQCATNDVTIFHDIDYCANTTMYKRIYDEVCSRDLWSNTYDFLCIPTLFLGQFETDSYLRNFEDTARFNLSLQRKFSEGRLEIETCAYGSSAIVLNKWHYLALGGSNAVFKGHGAEDYDLLHRLSVYCERGPRTVDYYTDTRKNDISTYRGFRAFFAIYGIDALQRGVFLVHLWHESRKHIQNYYQSKANFPLLEKCMRDFDQKREQPIPLVDLANSAGNCLILMGDTTGGVYCSLRQVFALHGRYEVMDESIFASGEELRDFVAKKQITSVGFLNPYGNEHRLALYRHLRQHDDILWVFDRGALPHSWFFDQGFNFDSPSYHPKDWDHPLMESEHDVVHDYIVDLRNGNETLEDNGARQSPEHLRAQYRLGNRKVLFIPLQRPSDTVTNYFAGPVGGMETFYNWIRYVAANLDRREWAVICKKHPLENDVPDIENVSFVDPQTHVHDLLEVADCVYLMNSGVGVLALAFGKPVVCAAQAFYAHDGLAVSANDPEESVAAIKNAISPDSEKTHRFYHHLVNRVYSFGVSKYKKSTASDGASRTEVQEILFEKINLLGKKYRLGKPLSQGAFLNSPLFASFGGRDAIKKLIEQSRKHKNQSTDVNVINPKKGIVSRIFHHCEKSMFYLVCNGERFSRYCQDREMFLRDSRFEVLRLYYKLTKFCF